MVYNHKDAATAFNITYNTTAGPVSLRWDPDLVTQPLYEYGSGSIWVYGSSSSSNSFHLQVLDRTPEYGSKPLVGPAFDNTATGRAPWDPTWHPLFATIKFEGGFTGGTLPGSGFPFDTAEVIVDYRGQFYRDPENQEGLYAQQVEIRGSVSAQILGATPEPIPEPTSILLLGTGLGALGLIAYRRRKK
jgi:hypothetical protein